MLVHYYTTQVYYPSSVTPLLPGHVYKHVLLLSTKYPGLHTSLQNYKYSPLLTIKYGSSAGHSEVQYFKPSSSILYF